jgi:hypothetical protein
MPRGDSPGAQEADMLERLRPRSAYDVIALLALCVAVGTGGAYAANTVRSEDIVDGEVMNADIGANAMTSSKLANGSVQNADLGPDAVTTSKIKAGNVGGTDLAANAVTSAKVLDDDLTGADIAEASLGSVPQADTLDGFDWTFFAQAGATAPDSELLDGLDSEDFLAATAKAADSDQLDGLDSKSFARIGGVINGDGSVSQGSGFTVTHPNEGEYQVSFPEGTLSGGLCPPVVTAIVFTGLIRHPQVSGRTCSGLGAGNFTLKTLDSDGVAHDTPFLFIAM